MTLNELLWTLRNRGLRLERRGDRLAVTGPPDGLTAELRAALKEHRDVLLEIAGDATGSNEQVPRPRTGPAPLSAQQESIWFVQELDPESSAYLLPIMIEFEGPLDVGAMKRAYRELLERHEPLRTRLVRSANGVEQQVQSAEGVDLPLVEVREPGEAGLASLWPSLLEPAFQLDAELPIRAVLARRGPELHQLVAVIHHSAGDGASYPLILRDLAAAYRGDPLPPMRLSYGDYAAWQKNRWTPARLESRLAFWRDRLTGAPPDLGVPTDRPRAERTAGRGQTVEGSIDGAALARLQETLAATGATLFNGVFAAFAVALYRQSGRRDFVLGVPVAGRDRSEWADMVGMFVDQLPVRLTFDPHQSLDDLIRAAAEASRSAVEHSLPFSRIVDALGARADGRRPLVQATVNLLPVSRGIEVSLGSANARLDVEGDLGGSLIGHARYDLTLYAHAARDRLRFSLVYDPALYNADRAEAILADFVKVFEVAPSDSGRSVASLCEPTSTPALLAIDESPADDRTIWQHVAEVASTRGEAVALEDDRGGRLDYAGLVEASQKIARLVGSTVLPDAPVGVLVPRSVQMGPALLGVLRSGRPYLPLDPAFPVERLQFMARDAGVGMVLTTADLTEFAEGIVDPGTPVRTVEEGLDSRPVTEDGELAESPAPSRTAYLLHTSGSTGRPKAVVQTQGNLARHAARYASVLGLGRGDRVALLASMAFDAFVMDFFGGLVSGATVVVVDLDAGRLDRVAEQLDAVQATVLHATPTVFRSLVRSADEGRFSTIRVVDLGGEAVRGSDVRLFDERFPDGAELINSYGPSEHTFALGFRVPRDLWRTTGIVPIGYPIGDVEAVLLDPEGVEDPVRGELALRSHRNAQGYWNRPDEEARAWIPDHQRPGARLYRTGDVVRRRHDGALVHEHRVDRQVKIRGVRVEPREVESVLVEHPSVEEVAVWAATGPDGTMGLAAAVVFAGGRGAVEEVRRWCGSYLSGPMTPTMWAALDSLPRTPTGKVDRASLPSVSEMGSVERTPLRSSTEYAVADLFGELLGVQEFGADDDFFAMGGHSLTAVELVARIRSECGVVLRLREVLEDSTVAGIAALVDAGSSDTGIPLERDPSTDPAPLSYAQERVWLAQLLDPDLTAYQMVIPIRIDGPVEVDRLESALAAAAEAHETLRTRVVARDGRPMQVIDERPSALRRVDEGGGDLGRWVAAETAAPIDLATQHPFRALLVALGVESYGLILTFHHIAVDGVSIRSFFDDFRRAYRGEALVPPPVRYRDYARWERRVVAQSEADDLAFWRDYLAEAPELLDLPTDRPRPARQSFTGARVSRRIEGDALEKLRALLAAERSTLFMGLLAATSTAIHRHSGQRDMVLGTPVTGRVRSELFGVVGMFADQLPLRMRVAPGATLRQVVQAARAAAVEAFRHQDLPFPKLLEGLGVERRDSTTPLFQAMVNVLPPLDPGVESEMVEGVRFSVPSPEELQDSLDQQSKYDFTMYGQDRGDAFTLTLVYNRDLYAAERMQAVLDDVAAVLEAATDRSDDEVEWVLRAEVESPTPRASTPLESVSARFARVAEQHGDRAAVVSADGTATSYRTLAAEVATLSRRLAALELPAGVPVGILLGHTPAAAAAILAVLGARHPYVPLDRRAPRERLRMMVSDAGIGALLVDEGTKEMGGELLDGTSALVAVDESGAEGSEGAAPVADDLAYLLYTSGSTGRPKAVRQSHRNLVVQADRYAQALEITPDDRLVLLASISFDAHLMDLFGALLNGASVVFVDLDQVDLARLPRQLEQADVRVLHTTPTVFRTLLRSAPTARWEGVRAVVLGGEPTRAADVAAFDEAFPTEARLYDLYGASEHSFAVGGWVDRTLHERTTEVPLGRPVGDVEAVLLDEEGREDPVRGVLALRSAHGALGYHARPDLEASAWIGDPDAQGRRLYRTGDRVRRRRDGLLVFLRRADDQLKIRGHRVEPGDVESVLETHPSVFEVGVHGPPDETGDPVLVACVVAKPGRSLDIATLIDWCRDRLPRAMVPTRWVQLDFLPRTVSGKIDRRRLPLPAAPEADAAGRAPRTDVESAVAAVWTEVLGREQVGVDDDFFTLGGHSLFAVQVVARLRTEFGVAVSLRDFFDHPTVAGIAALIEAGAADTGVPLERVESPDPAPLSYAQERVWLAQLLDPELTAYQMVVPIRIEGPLDAGQLEEAFVAACTVHETLRTRIEERDGRPVQVVDDAPVSIRRVDAEGGELGRWVAEEQQRPIDLATELPMRALLVRLRPDTHALILTFHHVAVDGVSIRTFFDDFRRAYRGETLDEPEVRYRDFARWERRVVEEADRDLEFWREYLAGAPDVLELPTDRPRPARQSFTGARATRTVDGAALSGLRELLSAERSTLFMGLLAATATAVHRHSGQRDMVLGTPVTGRVRSELFGVVGMFADQLPLRVQVARGATLRELLQAARATAVEAFRHQDLPFPRLIEGLGLERVQGRTPLFQAMVNVLPGMDSGAESEVVGDVRFSVPAPKELQSDLDAESKYDFTLYGQERGDAFVLTLAYNRDLYDAGRMEALLDDVVTLLESAATRSDEGVDAVLGVSVSPLVRLDENPARDASMWERFSEVASVRGDAPAVEDGTGARLSYSRVHALAEQVAAIVASSTAPGTPVGVLIDRTVAMAPALLGVLRSGRPYVPLDPGFPAERLAFMAGDAEIGLVLTTTGLADRAAGLAGPGVEVVCVDSLDARSEPAGALPPEPGPATVGYLLYTSGSTGQPKAVRQSQGNLARHAARYAAVLELGPDDRVALLASMAFDAFLMDFFGGLLAGAAAVIVDLDATGLDRVVSHLAASRATVLHTTPTVFRTLVRAAPDASFPSIRAVDLGGEAVRGDDVRLFDEHFGPEARLINSYGPSEHTFAFGFRVPRDLWRTTSEVPIGFPLGDVEGVLLATDGSVDPVRGELALRSLRSALGYWRRPDDEAKAWIPDPEHAGAVLYRTGDVVRRRADGALVYEHRVDRQVKIRGVRVEPSEVESVLLAHPSVREAVVWAPADPSGTRVLATAIVFEDDGGDLDQVRSWSSNRLSGPMTPTSWQALAELPRTPTGKIDRRRLQLPAPTAKGSEVRAARTETERAVATLWAEVLGRDAVGVDEDFFALGGHSLRGVQVVAGVRVAFGIDLPLRHLFDHPTVEATAAWIDDHRDSGMVRPPLVSTGAADRPSALSFSQERMWFMQEVNPQGTAYNIGAAFLERGPVDLDRLAAAFQEVGRRHAVLRSRYALVDGTLLQSTSPDLDLTMEIRDGIDDGSGDAVQRAADWVSSRLFTPYDLAGDPLARLVVARVGPEMHALGVGMHHIAGDMVSMGILLREMVQLYFEPATPLPALPVQYADFSSWQRGWLQGELLDRELDFWGGRLEGLTTLDLAVDRPWPKVFDSAGARWATDLDPELVARIHDHAAREGVTPFALLFAAFDIMLHSYSRQDDIAVGVPVAHRDRRSVEHLIGTFVNTVVVRTDLSDDPSFATLVDRVKDHGLEAMEHGDLPFELLVRKLAAGRNASRPPLAQVLFNVVHVGEIETAMIGEETSPLELGREASQFELGAAAVLANDRARITLSYATALFDRTTIDAMARHFLGILERGLADPERTVSELRGAPPVERERLRVLGTGSGSDAEPAFESVPSQVARRALAHPDRIAVSSADGAYSYAELLERARSVTATLSALGVAGGDRVAVMMERGHDMVAVLLGILGTGAAYVPLDPGYPESRIEFMLDDSGAVALVTHRGLQQGFATQVAVVDVDRPLDPPAAEFVVPPAEDPAYVIYTSGSTGKPKGVVLPHRSMVNFLRSMAHTPGFTADDVLVAVTTISFDISVLELYLPLVQGGRLFVANEREASNGRALGRRLESEGATLLQATPATWKVLLAAGWKGRPELRALAGGEALPPDLAVRLVEVTGELWNMYGPTETTVWSTVSRIEPGDPITIGHPIDATRLLVVDATGVEAPIGVPGELWIGGAGVALGYHRRPELTADRFVERETDGRSARFYRTGDLVRWRGDGRLEHLGRMDDQVKVRGFRIELGEVESALRGCPGVADAACAARDDRLIAWFVPEEQPGPTIAEFRGWMRDRLPAYMMPALFVAIDSIPLTPNGKVDRRSLPDPGAQLPQATVYEAPEGPVETLLAEVWAKLLEVERVGAGDYFFELGGHSLLAMQAVAEFEERSGLRLEPRALFFNTVRELAASAEPLPVEQQ